MHYLPRHKKGASNQRASAFLLRSNGAQFLVL
jgi:hypothetical protein